MAIIICTAHAVVFLACFLGVTGYGLTVEPRRVTLSPGHRATILCRSSTPLDTCTFLLPGGVIVDLSGGAATQPSSEYRYYGTGLENGQCGITITTPPTGFNVVACRGWSEKEGWKRTAMFLRVTTTPTLPWELEPRHAVVLPGQDLNFLCRSRIALTDCRFGFINQDRWLSFPEGASTPATSEFRYLGAGLQKGECGVTMFKVKEDMSGEVRCVAVSNTRWAGDFMTLVVAKSPDPPDLEISSNEVREGDVMEATCSVKNARPAANITWYMNGKVVDKDIVDATPGDAWFDYELQSTVQQFKLKVTHADNGKELKCVASHVALFDHLNQETKVLDVKFAPRDLKVPSRQSGIAVGRASTIRVEIMANPQPILTWTIGYAEVKDDDPEANGRFKAVLAVKKGIGRWEARLHIRDFTEDDYNVDYLLYARNQIGSNTFRIKLPRSGSSGAPGSSAPVSMIRPSRPAATPTAPTPPTPRPTDQKQGKDPFARGNCGHAVLTSPLIVNGTATEEGHWPWTAAIFAKKPRSAGLEFQCGGTLINNRQVVTAAHCIVIDNRNTLTHDDLLIFLGKYNLNDWGEVNSQLKKISEIHIHPDYVPGVAGNGSDIAVLTLKTQATYTAYISPVCMWNGDLALENIVGKSGVVVGWGRFGVGDKFVSDIPKKASNRIVSQEECLRSNADFYLLTSDKTFCAGNRDGSGPCNGDSGSGLVLPYSSSGKVRWFLRGIVSLSLLDRNTSICDLTHFLIYTDVAKFTDWIQQTDSAATRHGNGNRRWN